MKVLLLYGGASPEHSVSCVSAVFIDQCLRKEGFSVIPVYIDLEKNWYLQEEAMPVPQDQLKNPCFLDLSKEKRITSLKGEGYSFDIAFPIIHGATGEDGKLQGLFEFLNIPFVGAGSLTSAICMNKLYTKTLLKSVGIPVLPFMGLSLTDWKRQPDQVAEEILKEFKLPVFVKPCNLGSSIGISQVQSTSELKTALENAFQYGSQVIIEKGIQGRELEVAMTGNYPEYKITTVGEIIVGSDFYSYEAKYIDSTAKLNIPASITPEQKALIQGLAENSFYFLNGSGFSRVDFFLDQSDENIYLSEINTLPGFTPISMFPKLWAYERVNSGTLVAELVELGLKRSTGSENLSEEILKTLTC